MTPYLCFIVNVFNAIIISVANFVCVLLYVIERVYRLLSLNPEYNYINNHNHYHRMENRVSNLVHVPSKASLSNYCSKFMLMIEVKIKCF